MKRGRTSGKSGSGDASSKEEPPKKVKKRIKQSAAPSTSAATVVATPPSTPGSVVNQPSLSLPQKETKLGSLPLYGEQLPAGGYDDIPGIAQCTCAQLKEVMTKVRELKRNSSVAEEEKVHVSLVGIITLKEGTSLSKLSSGASITCHTQHCSTLLVWLSNPDAFISGSVGDYCLQAERAGAVCWAEEAQPSLSPLLQGHTRADPRAKVGGGRHPPSAAKPHVRVHAPQEGDHQLPRVQVGLD